jgi:hypothetical protein
MASFRLIDSPELRFKVGIQKVVCLGVRIGCSRHVPRFCLSRPYSRFDIRVAFNNALQGLGDGSPFLLRVAL